MSDVYIHFIREDLQGTVAVGSYLSDVLKRFGIRCADECDRASDTHECEISISAGEELLSPLTGAEPIELNYRELERKFGRAQ